MYNLLVIDDNFEFREIIQDYLCDTDFVVYEAACPHDAFQMLYDEKFDVILCDLQMPFTLGEEFFKFQYSAEVGLRTINELSELFPGTPVIAMSALASADIAKIRKRIQGVTFLPKPFRQADFLELLSTIVGKYSAVAVQ